MRKIEPIKESVKMDTRKYGRDKLVFYPSFVMKTYYRLYNRIVETKYYYKEYTLNHTNYATNGLWSLVREYY